MYLRIQLDKRKKRSYSESMSFNVKLRFYFTLNGALTSIVLQYGILLSVIHSFVFLHQIKQKQKQKDRFKHALNDEI